MKGLKATGPSVGWCFPQIKGLKATGHSVARGGVVLPLQQGPKGTDIFAKIQPFCRR
ncbi:hypothetical protein PR002_g32425 [Phytophthora rubi]|uniref:Uncharacterized protein n=1 Tax=Phytophthora rubi TaxID=129364 RepID=A0A6A3G4E2_9STRA|nr:hypothetical protein PR002_g32425 [Phytophthora rubi]